MPVDGVDDYINKGLYYQNPFVYWFNHYHEPDYQGQQFQVIDDAMVIGGGLASLDVVKILMIETVQEALIKRGHQVDMFTLDRSISKVLDNLGYTLQDLGLKDVPYFIDVGILICHYLRYLLKPKNNLQKLKGCERR